MMELLIIMQIHLGQIQLHQGQIQLHLGQIAFSQALVFAIEKICHEHIQYSVAEVLQSLVRLHACSLMRVDVRPVLEGLFQQRVIAKAVTDVGLQGS